MKYLLGLVLCMLLTPLAKADGYQPSSVYLLGLGVYSPIQLFSRLDIGAGGFSFGGALQLEGGIVGYTKRRDARAHIRKQSQSLPGGIFRRSSSKKFSRTVTLSVDLTCVPPGFRTTAKRFPSGAKS